MVKGLNKLGLTGNAIWKSWQAHIDNAGTFNQREDICLASCPDLAFASQLIVEIL